MVLSSSDVNAGHCRKGSTREQIRCLNSEVSYLTSKYKETRREVEKLRSEMSSIADAAVPIGTIMPWYSTSEELPKGWKLCDGLEGRPNLNGLWIVGTTDARKNGTLVNEDSNVTISGKTKEATDGNKYAWGDTEDETPHATGLDHKHEVEFTLDRLTLAPKSMAMRFIIKVNR